MSDLSAPEIDALLGALRDAREAFENTEGAMTANELAEKMGKDIKETRKRIGLLLKQKRAECVPVKRERIDGRSQTVPAYRLVA